MTFHDFLYSLIGPMLVLIYPAAIIIVLVGVVMLGLLIRDSFNMDEDE